MLQADVQNLSQTGLRNALCEVDHSRTYNYTFVHIKCRATVSLDFPVRYSPPGAIRRCYCSCSSLFFFI